MGMIDKSLRIRVIHCPLEMNCLFCNANLLWNLFFIPLQDALGLSGAPKGTPKQE